MYKQKLIDLLKSDEQIKEAMEKLDFGCKIKDENGKEYIFWNMCKSGNSFDTITKEGGIDRFYYPMRNNIIIGLPLQERFIRMYCENNFYNNIDKIIEGFPGEKQDEARYVNFCLNETFTKLEDLLSKQDNTKDFDNQDDLVYQRIYEALLELNK